MAFDHLEIWDDLEAAGGVRLSVVPDLLALTDTRSLRRDDTLGFAMPVASPAASDLLENRVIRVVDTDQPVEEWLIAKFAESRSPAGLIIKGTAGHISGRMLAALVARSEVDGTVILDFEGVNLTATDQWNAFIEPALTDAGITYFTLGTVDPTLRFDLLYEWDTPLSALEKLATALGVEIQFRRNGAVDYKVDILTAIGASATTVDMRIGSKLKGLKRTRSTVEQSTRVYPRGEETDGFHADMGRARWRILAFTGTTIDLEDAAGGLGPIEFDDQLNTYHLIRVSDDNDFGAITDSAVTNQRLTFASTAGAAVGDICEVFETATKRLVFLESPADKVTYGLKSAVIDRPDVSGTINLAPNPALANFTGGNPDNWSAVLTPTLTQVTATDKWRVGGNSVRVQTNADGEGIETDYVTITPSTVQPFFSAFMGFLLAVGKIRVELVATDGSATFIFPDPAVDKKAISNQINVWTDLGVEGIDLQEKSVIQVKIRVLQDGTGTADFHVDLAQITQTAEQLSFMVGAGPTVLWQEANLQLRAHGVPGIRYDIDTMDLSRFDPVTWPDADHAPVLGGKVRVTDVELSIVGTTTRILEQSRNLFEDLNTKLVLSSRPEDLSDALVRSRTKRKKREADPPEFIDLKALTIRHVKHRSLGGKVTFMYIGGVDVKSIRFATSTTGFPDPSAGTIVEGQFGRGVPAGTFTFGDIVFITIRPFSGAGATGSTGPDFEFRVELEAKEDQTDGPTGRRKRPAEFDDGKFALISTVNTGKTIEANTDVAGAIHIVDTSSPKVGTAAVPSKKTKTLRVTAMDFLPKLNSSEWDAQGIRMIPATANVFVAYNAGFVFPKNTKITKLTVRHYRETTSDQSTVNMFSVDDTEGTSQLANVVHNTTGYQTQSATMSHDVDGSKFYSLNLIHRGVLQRFDTRLLWLEFEYEMSDYIEAY